MLPPVSNMSDKSDRVLSPEQRLPDSKTNRLSFQWQQGMRYLLLAKANETLENKEGAILFYKEALKANCENFEAFDRLVSNFLITQSQKEELLKEMTFSSENLWLRDYYSSRISLSLRSTGEQEGVVRRQTYADSSSSHLCLHSEADESGATPPRFLSEALYKEDLPLRQAKENQLQKVQTTGPRAKTGDVDPNQTPSQMAVATFVEVAVLDSLKQRGNKDILMIEA